MTRSSRRSHVGAIGPVLTACIASALLIPAPAHAATHCDWRSDVEVLPRFPSPHVGPVDRSMDLDVKAGLCTTGGGRYEKAAQLWVTNHSANGKRDVVVALKTPPLGPVVVHPRVPAGTTWHSSVIDMSERGSRDNWAEIRVVYDRYSSFGASGRWCF